MKFKVREQFIKEIKLPMSNTCVGVPTGVLRISSDRDDSMGAKINPPPQKKKKKKCHAESQSTTWPGYTGTTPWALP